MKLFSRRLVIYGFIASAIGLSACSGDDDADDRLDVADPAIRFVHASPIAPNVTLFRDNVAQADATDVPYKFASNYFDVSGTASQWSVKTALSGVVIGEELINPSRGNKFTIVALSSSSTENSIYVIRDPYNKSITSDKAKLRIVNASFNASNVDLYINAPDTDISPVGVIPVVSGTAFKTAGPASGNDSLDIEGGTYQIAITAGGSKTVLFKATIIIENNKDILLLTVPNSSVPTGIKTLMKIEGLAGTTELPAS
jgi:Domain of unknown function (DUF4397)